MIRIGDRIRVQSGDVVADATVKAVHPTAGLFVQTDVAVPVKVGDTVTTGDRLWVKPGVTVVFDKDGVAVGAEG